MVESCGKAALLTDEDVVPVSQVDRGWLCNRLLQASTLRAVDRRRDEGLAGDAEGGTVGDEAAGEPLGDSGGAGQQNAARSTTDLRTCTLFGMRAYVLHILVQIYTPYDG